MHWLRKNGCVQQNIQPTSIIQGGFATSSTAAREGVRASESLSDDEEDGKVVDEVGGGYGDDEEEEKAEAGEYRQVDEEEEDDDDDDDDDDDEDEVEFVPQETSQISCHSCCQFERSWVISQDTS